MQRFLSSLLLLLTACDEPNKTGRSDTVPWFVWEEQQRPSAELLQGVEDILGLELVESEKPYGVGAVTLFIVDRETGWSHSGGWSCTPYAYLEVHDAHTVAHEIGHAFSLEHVDDPQNLMFPAGSGNELTEEQTDTIRKKLWETEQYCR